MRPILRTPIVWIALVICLVAPLSGSAADADPGIRLQAFAGDWRLLDMPQSDASRLAAIDRAIAGLSWVVRKMASPILSKSTAPPPEVAFIWDGEQLHQRVRESDGREQRRTIDLGGPLRESRDSRGDPFHASWQWKDAGLELRWEQHQANGSNFYRIDPARGALIVRHTIQVTAIENVAPIVFESSFRRADLPTVSAARSPSHRAFSP